MAVKYTKEQLNSIDHELLIQMFLNQQEQMEQMTAEIHDLNDKIQKILEQVVLEKKYRFGCSAEGMTDVNQISFMEVDGAIVFFNEAEAVCDPDAEEPDDLSSRPRGKKQKGKREEDMNGLPTERIDHYLSEETLASEFGENGWKQLPDEIAQGNTTSHRRRSRYMSTISAFTLQRQTATW